MVRENERIQFPYGDDHWFVLKPSWHPLHKSVTARSEARTIVHDRTKALREEQRYFACSSRQSLMPRCYWCCYDCCGWSQPIALSWTLRALCTVYIAMNGDSALPRPSRLSNLRSLPVFNYHFCLTTRQLVGARHFRSRWGFDSWESCDGVSSSLSSSPTKAVGRGRNGGICRSSSRRWLYSREN